MNHNIITLDLQFFSAESEGRTEKATAKKREDVRKKGQVAKSNELNTAAILLTFFILLNVLGQSYLNYLEENIVNSVKLIPYVVLEADNKTILSILGNGFIQIIKINGILWIGIMIIALLIAYIQVGYYPTLKPLAPKFNKMNPLTGMKKIFSMDSIVELIKSVAKVTILGFIAYSVIKPVIPTFVKLYEMTTLQALLIVSSTIYEIGLKVGIGFLLLSIGDYIYQKFKFEDSIKMSKQEVKEEYRQAEGDPAIRGKIRQKMREMSFKRMMQAIPQADVIITNPTHFAVAVQYDETKNAAPIVVAKGADYVAQKIKEVAKEHNVQIVENKVLARTLYYTVDLQEEIPEELYGAIAEILAFVYKLENRSKNRRGRR